MDINNNTEQLTSCKNCGSENVYFSKKQKCYVCEDCGSKFTTEVRDKSLRIFLSYGHDESAFVVEEIRKLLLEKGHNPWVDKFKIKGGDDWRSHITSGILGSDDFIAFITNHSTRVPGVCLDEIAIALGTKSCGIQSVLLEKDATVPSSISTKQWNDLSEWKQKYQQGEQVWRSWLNQKTDEIVAAINNPSNAKKSIQISQIIKAIHPLTPEMKLKQLLTGNILSRKWLFKKIRDWYDADSKCMMLIGGPGAGKSVLCAQLSHYMAQCAGLYFLEWNNAESRNLKNMLLSIFFQLCCNIDDFRERVVNDILCVKEPLSEDFIVSQLLLTPLNFLVDGDREDRFVIIDALDEYGEEERNIALRRLKRLIDGSPRWLRWILTCRPWSDEIQYYLNAKVVCIDDCKDDIRKDIKEFCKGFLDDKGKAELVVAKSNGSFVYAKELVEAINLRHVDSSDLEQLPATLSAIFMTNFHRIIGGENYSLYKPLISLLLVAQEPVQKKTIRNVLDIEDEKLNDLISRLKSFINVEIDPHGLQRVSVYHKSISDWFFSPESSSYKISKEDAHHVISDYLVKHLDEVENDEYLSKYAYTHLRNAKQWVNLDYQQKKKLLLFCISASDKFGNLYYENQYLTIYKEELEEDVPFLMAELHYLQKTDSREVERIVERLVGTSAKCVDEKLRFEAKVNAAMGLFYIGRDSRSFELLTSMQSEYEKKFKSDDKYAAMYAHALSLPSHDFDYNEKAVEASDTSARMHHIQNNNYKYFVALVNKFDALMGCGKIYEAFSTAMTVFSLNEEKYFVHIDDILQICYANLLQTTGRIMEALSYYEKGIAIAKRIHKWDYLYGCIWRELAIARFGDGSCLRRLESYIALASEADYKYLVSLGNCFYLLSVYLLNIDVGNSTELQEKVKNGFNKVLSCGYQGHIAQVKASAFIRNWGGLLDHPLEYDEIMLSLEGCQGVKGCPDVINTFFDLQEGDNKSQQWKEKYLLGLVRYKKSYYDNNISNLSVEPLLQMPNCEACEAKCCYDGAYLEKKEAEHIENFVTNHQERFENLKQDFIVQGTWVGLEHLKKTATKMFDYKGDFPQHFNKTRCVFCNDEGLCLLQVVATDLQMHPWSVKPRACWSFPIHGVRDGNIIPPPKIDEPDPNDIGSEYPGYVTYLPCGKAQLQGKSWRDVYMNEIEYYIYLMKSGEL